MKRALAITATIALALCPIPILTPVLIWKAIQHYKEKHKKVVAIPSATC